MSTKIPSKTKFFALEPQKKPEPPELYSSGQPKRPRARHRGGSWITSKRRQLCYERDDRRCVWCDTETDDLTLDHIVPDGGNESTNLATACRSCNSRRRGIPLGRWMDMLILEGANEGKLRGKLRWIMRGK